MWLYHSALIKRHNLKQNPPIQSSKFRVQSSIVAVRHWRTHYLYFVICTLYFDKNTPVFLSASSEKDFIQSSEFKVQFLPCAIGAHIICTLLFVLCTLSHPLSPQVGQTFSIRQKFHTVIQEPNQTPQTETTRYYGRCSRSCSHSCSHNWRPNCSCC